MHNFRKTDSDDLNGRQSGVCVAWLFALCTLLSACHPALLNSERIDRQFGSYGIDVLESSASHRVSNLYSVEGEANICRSLAVVLFQEPMDDDLTLEHAQIVSGGSIGAVFKANGWTISKVNLKLGSVHVADNAVLISKLMHVAVPNELAMHIYRFELTRRAEHIRYATIVEIHHPAYLDAAELQRIYGSLPAEALAATALAAIEARIEAIMSR